jgi:hypothetical protein
MLDAVAAQKKELLSRSDHQRLDELETAHALGFDEAGHSEAAQGQAGSAHEREHEKQCRKVPAKIDEIHGGHLIASTLIGG